MADWSVGRVFQTLCLLGLFVLPSQSDLLPSIEDVSILHRTKRATSCHPKYSIITSGHTACLPDSPKLKDSGVSQADMQTILDDHNTVRQAIRTATNMRELTWNDEIANTAQRWADSCNVGRHDKGYKRYAYGKFSVGQNLSWGSYKMGWKKAIQLWSDEIADFTYGAKNTFSEVGHYTQMVWAATSKVGCGYALCGDTHYYVCDYAPGGNSDYNRPYERGASCAKCPDTCNNNLCDCHGAICFNGGMMDLNKCTCTCTTGADFYVLPSCSLNCTDIKDPRVCSQYEKADCEKYTNVPQLCPDMCKWCPSAGAKFVSAGSHAHFGLVSLVLPAFTAVLTILT